MFYTFAYLVNLIHFDQIIKMIFSERKDKSKEMIINSD